MHVYILVAIRKEMHVSPVPSDYQIVKLLRLGNERV